MGLGSTAKKLQQLAEQADELYQRFSEVRDQIRALRNTVEGTEERVRSIERELATQRALLEAIAEAQGVDVEETIDDASTETETETETEADEPTDADSHTAEQEPSPR